jgi:hypothetical protein
MSDSSGLKVGNLCYFTPQQFARPQMSDIVMIISVTTGYGVYYKVFKIDDRTVHTVSMWSLFGLKFKR